MVSAGGIAEGISSRYGMWDENRFWSIDDWKKHLIKGRGKSNWRILPQKIINNRAYMDLSFPAREALTQAFNICGTQKVTLTGDKRKRNKVTYVCLPFCLPLNLLRAVGFGCDRTAIRAIRELIGHGFIEIVEQRPGRATVYQMSDNYREYQPLS